MSYTLVGSLTSPFVRRLRLVMENIPFTMKEINIFETEDGLELNRINPINQIPVLLDDETPIWDSRHIFNYLNKKYAIHEMTLEMENNLTAIDSALSSAITLFLMKRSGMDITESYMFINRQKERIDSVLDYLKPYIETKACTEWNFVTISLYAFLDWGSFRGMVDLSNRPECTKFLEAHANREIVKSTSIPKV
jgi:glutathione S-transferase